MLYNNISSIYNICVVGEFGSIETIDTKSQSSHHDTNHQKHDTTLNTQFNIQKVLMNSQA